MKKLFEMFRRFAQKEALEFTNDEPSSESYRDEYLKKLSTEVEELNHSSMEAYESGNIERAEKFDSLFAEKQEELENFLSGREPNDNETGEEDFPGGIHSGGLDELTEQLAMAYFNYKTIGNVFRYNFKQTEEEYLEYLRALAKDYGYAHGGFKEETTDEQLLDAAEDAYKNYSYFKRFGGKIEKVNWLE